MELLIIPIVVVWVIGWSVGVETLIEGARLLLQLWRVSVPAGVVNVSSAGGVRVPGRYWGQKGREVDMREQFISLSSRKVGLSDAEEAGLRVSVFFKIVDAKRWVESGEMLHWEKFMEGVLQAQWDPRRGLAQGVDWAEEELLVEAASAGAGFGVAVARVGAYVEFITRRLA